MRKAGELMIGASVVAVLSAAILYSRFDGAFLAALVGTSIWVAAIRYDNNRKPLSLFALFPHGSAVVYVISCIRANDEGLQYAALAIAFLSMAMLFAYKKGSSQVP